LLLANNLEDAQPLAQNLDLRNRNGRKSKKSIVEEVIGVVRSKI